MAVSAPPAPAAAAAHLAVAGLGPLRVEIDGRPVPFRAGRRERGVFQYLLLHRRRPVPREELTEVFWPGSSPSHARNNLNVSVWGLRNRLREPLGGRSVCVFEDGAYRLDPSLAIRVDAEELERLVAAARVRRRAGDIEGAAAHLRVRGRALRGRPVRGRPVRGVDRSLPPGARRDPPRGGDRPRRVRAAAGRRRRGHRPLPAGPRRGARARGSPPPADAVLRGGRPALRWPSGSSVCAPTRCAVPWAPIPAPRRGARRADPAGLRTPTGAAEDWHA